MDNSICTIHLKQCGSYEKTQLPVTSVYYLVIGLYNEKARKIVCNAWLQPPVAEKKPHFGGVLPVKIVC